MTHAQLGLKLGPPIHPGWMTFPKTSLTKRSTFWKIASRMARVVSGISAALGLRLGGRLITTGGKFQGSLVGTTFPIPTSHILVSALQVQFSRKRNHPLFR